MIHLANLIDDAKCYETVRHLRWPSGVLCPWCDSSDVIKRGKDDTQPFRQRYECHGCGRQFDDLTQTIFAGHHRPLKEWVICLYLMGLNQSNEQIAKELDLDKNAVHEMACLLREGIVARKPTPHLSGTVECDEVYQVAGHKGHPDEVQKRGAKVGGAA
jgi:transposase-like protein